MILRCESLALFEAVKLSSVRGPTDLVAKLTWLGWMVGGKTYPEPSPDAEGESRMVSGDCGVVREDNNRETPKKVRIVISACGLLCPVSFRAPQEVVHSGLAAAKLGCDVSAQQALSIELNHAALLKWRQF